MTLNIQSSRRSEASKTLLELLVDTATRSAKELYRRVMANKRTEIMFSISEREGVYYVCLNAGPLTSEEGAFYLLADLLKQHEATMKECAALGSGVEDKNDAPPA